MKKLHKQILARQANLLERMALQIDVSRNKRFINSDDKEWRKVVVSNNRYFNPMKTSLKGLSVGRKAKLVRSLIESEMRDVPSVYGLVGWANTYDVKSNLRKGLVKMGVIPELSNDVSHVTREPKVTITTNPNFSLADVREASPFAIGNYTAHAEL